MPTLECSSRGDRRFSAFHARFPDGRSIESIYQTAKVGLDGLPVGKGRRPAAIRLRDGQEFPVVLLSEFYYSLWWHYLARRSDLVAVLRSYNKFTDAFDRSGRTWLVAENHTIVGKGPINSQAEAIAAYLAGRNVHQAFR